MHTELLFGLVLVFRLFSFIKMLLFYLPKQKTYCCNIAVISAQCFRTGGDLLYLLSGGIWPREAEIKHHVAQSCCRARHLSSARDLG